MRVLRKLTIGLASGAAFAALLPAVAGAEDWKYVPPKSDTAAFAASAPVPSWDEGLKTPSLAGARYDEDLSFGPVVYQTPQGPVAYASRELWFDGAGGSVDRLRVTSGGPIYGASGAPLRLDGHAVTDNEAYDVSYTRGWPSALRLKSGEYAFDVTPHAGLGMTSAGGSAEAGATLIFGKARQDSGLSRFGVQNGAAFGGMGRWYLYAEASGRAIGYNFLKGDNGWRRSGMSTDDGAFIGDRQAGVAWRKGDLQASFGYVDRKVRLDNIRSVDVDTHSSMVAFTLSFKPGG